MANFFDPPRFKAGSEIRSSDENAANDEIRRLGSISGSAGIDSRGGAFALAAQEAIYIELTGAANASGGYPWQEVIAQALRTWVASGRVGSNGSAPADPAYAISGTTTYTSGPMVYRAKRAITSGEWIFDG